MDNKKLASELLKLAKTINAAGVDKRFFWFADQKMLRLFVTHTIARGNQSVNATIRGMEEAFAQVSEDIYKEARKIRNILPVKTGTMEDFSSTDGDEVTVSGQFDIQLREHKVGMKPFEEYVQEIFDMLTAEGWHR